MATEIDGYINLPWIHNYNGAFIDTGIAINTLDNPIIETEFMYDTGPSRTGSYFGNKGGVGPSDYNGTIGWVIYSYGIMQFCFGSNGPRPTTYMPGKSFWDLYPTNVYHKLTIGDGVTPITGEIPIYVNDIQVAYFQSDDAASFDNVKNLLIFTGQRNSPNFPMKSFKITDTNVNIHLEPKLRVQDHKPGMYDIINNVFYTNAGDSEFVYPPIVSMKYTKAIRTSTAPIINGYQDLEYLKSTGAQWIDTGIAVNTLDNPIIETEIDYITNAGGSNHYFGTSATVTSSGTLLWYLYVYGVLQILWGTKSPRGVTYEPGKSFWDLWPQHYGFYKLKIGNSLISITDEVPIYVNDVQVAHFNTDANAQFTDTNNLLLFRGRVIPVAVAYKSFKITDTHVNINLKPKMRLSDNKVGMYDIVNDVFYTNAGTGEFEYPNPWHVTKKKLIKINDEYKQIWPGHEGGLSFTGAEDGSTIKYVNNGTNNPNVKYSYNGLRWQPWTANSPVSLNTGDTIYVKGANATGFSYGVTNYSNFVMTGKIEAAGNINSLLDNGNGSSITEVPRHSFRSLFYNCTSLISSPEFPATIINDGCYYTTFYGCSNLVTPPSILPATESAGSEYVGMFENCSSLIKAPKILLANLKNHSCNSMFANCSLLKISENTGDTDKLVFVCPQDTSSFRCVYNMFAGTCGTFTGTPTAGNSYYWYE